MRRERPNLRVNRTLRSAGYAVRCAGSAPNLNPTPILTDRCPVRPPPGVIPPQAGLAGGQFSRPRAAG